MSNVVAIRGHRACAHCGQPALNHILAMTEKRCPDRSGRRFEALPTKAPSKRSIARAFDDEEAAAMMQLFKALYAGGDVKQLLKRAAVVGVVKKFSDIHELFTGGKQS